MKCGFIKDNDNQQLKEVFTNNKKLKEIHIDIYQENPLVFTDKPFMLLLRTIEKQTIASNDGDRLIIKRIVDNFDTYFMNVLFSKITECYYKRFGDCSEFILKIQNIYYKITVFN